MSVRKKIIAKLVEHYNPQQNVCDYVDATHIGNDGYPVYEISGKMFSLSEFNSLMSEVKEEWHKQHNITLDTTKEIIAKGFSNAVKEAYEKMVNDDYGALDPAPEFVELEEVKEYKPLRVFRTGEIVRFKKGTMSHPKNTLAVVCDSYFERFGPYKNIDRDINCYHLIILDNDSKPVGTYAWADLDEIEIVSTNSQYGLKLITYFMEVVGEERKKSWQYETPD